MAQLFAVTFFLFLLPPQNLFAFRAMTEVLPEPQQIILPTPAPLPINIQNHPPPEISAEGVVIVDIDSGVSLYEKNPELRLLPASTTKIMTALVALTDYQLNEVVTVDTVITTPYVMDLVKDETITVESLLYGILVHSANDAAFALAEHHAGGVAGFVDRMNELTQTYFLQNTHLTNPIGFDDTEHYTTARDLARLSVVASKSPLLTKIASTQQITVSDTEYLRFHGLKNVNELIGKLPGVSGFKTGWTAAAGGCLVTTVERGNHMILITLLHSADRFGETEQLIEWAFGTYEWQEFNP
ncbi:TPA: hypothetical protein DIV55_00735 [Patescibacteria group bacterium]|uniref:Peptidase S11 D-alanyl-D-alanine carboxypeptidase A N-terminal domain-containing protein n=1 Tax=Candidatus Gottesmanbacteria bacterium GW2011_GWA1_43_11 TaxID=1618436 RepID=A0A0G1EQZ5_9BACT|nr:MAG: hypothetical protein UV59_C0007G0054 [Candidatus Gottesmanbacteria bacterium GW2011_GWA1_43_11]HCS78250.1 hypothetical protein [Patescibacteria group bacterium]